MKIKNFWPKSWILRLPIMEALLSMKNKLLALSKPDKEIKVWISHANKTVDSLAAVIPESFFSLHNCLLLPESQKLLCRLRKLPAGLAVFNTSTPLHIWWESMLKWKVQAPVISLFSLNAQCAKDSDTLEQIPSLLGTSEDGLFVRLESLSCLYSLKNRLRGTCCVRFSLCSTPQASRKVYFLIYPNFLLCYFNTSWFCPAHAAPEEQQILHWMGQLEDRV